MKESEKMSKEEIKKMKKKVIKVLVIVLILALIIWGGLTFQKMMLLEKIQDKALEINQKDNGYCKITYYEGENAVYSSEFYKKGSKILLKMKGNRVAYKDISTNEAWLISNDEKIAIKYKPENILINDIPNPSYIGEEDSFKYNLIYSLTSSLTSEKVGDTNCYKFNNFGQKVWINKENLLPKKITVGIVEKDGKKYKTYYMYEYNWGTVTDEQVKLPDLTEYSIKEQK